MEESGPIKLYQLATHHLPIQQPNHPRTLSPATRLKHLCTHLCAHRPTIGAAINPLIRIARMSCKLQKNLGTDVRLIQTALPRLCQPIMDFYFQVVTIRTQVVEGLAIQLWDKSNVIARLCRARNVSPPHLITQISYNLLLYLMSHTYIQKYSTSCTFITSTSWLSYQVSIHFPSFLHLDFVTSRLKALHHWDMTPSSSSDPNLL